MKGSWLKGFDLKTGAGKISARFPGKKNFCNDIAIDRDGAIFVTNSFQPEILNSTPRHKNSTSGSAIHNSTRRPEAWGLTASPSVPMERSM